MEGGGNGGRRSRDLGGSLPFLSTVDYILRPSFRLEKDRTLDGIGAVLDEIKVVEKVSKQPTDARYLP